MMNHILDVEPGPDRTMWATWQGTKQLTTINTHIPQAMRNKEENEKTYKEIDKVIRANTSKGPVVTAGDFNARIQKATNSEERKIIGQWTFEPETARVHGRVEGVMENRNLLIEHCTSHYLTICNTWFKKP